MPSVKLLLISNPEVLTWGTMKQGIEFAGPLLPDPASVGRPASQGILPEVEDVEDPIVDHIPAPVGGFDARRGMRDEEDAIALVFSQGLEFPVEGKDGGVCRNIIKQEFPASRRVDGNG